MSLVVSYSGFFFGSKIFGDQPTQQDNTCNVFDMLCHNFYFCLEGYNSNSAFHNFFASATDFFASATFRSSRLLC